ncbi:O-antigen ligase family protein [Acinetobacter sp. MF4642]|uniref:O-antigen ligase family protein n=1 Tax=Acinetobacter sp. MF4642 TaxID=1960825 RepID=UPI000994C837|nr:O-antigen ligase family protein [Acinetobacter sp. MF4642]
MQNYLSKILLILIPFFCFIAYSSLSIYWTSYPYDAWRIYEILILFIFSFSHFLIKNQYLTESRKAHLLTFISIISISFLAILTISFSTAFDRAIAEASLIFLLINFTLIYSFLIKKYSKLSKNIATSIAFLPMLSLIFLPLALVNRLQGGDGVWTQSFTNIRMLDDALLPCLFLIWLQPIYSNFDFQKNKLLKSCLYIVSTIYVLSFLFHGARACLLSIFIGLCISLIFTPNHQRKFLKLPIISLILALVIFNLYHLSFSEAIGPSINRITSSGRLDLWEKAVHLWFEHPILGVGGNNFMLHTPFLLPTHPHNFFLKSLSEWGIAIFILILSLIPIIQAIYKQRKNIPIFLIAGAIAIFSNSLLSGSFVYPVSQIISLTFIAFLLSFLKVYTISEPTSYFQYNKKLWAIISYLSLIALLYIHGQDILCYTCISIDDFGAPNFWDQGRAIHLLPISNLHK